MKYLTLEIVPEMESGETAPELFSCQASWSFLRSRNRRRRRCTRGWHCRGECRQSWHGTSVRPKIKQLTSFVTCWQKNHRKNSFLRSTYVMLPFVLKKYYLLKLKTSGHNLTGNRSSFEICKKQNLYKHILDRYYLVRTKNWKYFKCS